MKNRFYVIVAVFLCLAALLAIKSRVTSISPREATAQSNGSSEKSPLQSDSESGSSPHSGIDSNQTAKSSNPLKKASSINSIQRLSDIGYVIAADHIDEHSAEGSLEITAPDGTKITGGKLTLSTEKELFLVTRVIKMVIHKDQKQMTMEPNSPDAFLQIDPIKGAYTLSSNWSLSSKTIPKD